MSTPVIEETVDIPTRQKAEQRKFFYEQESPPWFAEIVEEEDGEFTLRAFPPDHPRPGGATNSQTEERATPLQERPERGETKGIRRLLDFIAKLESNGNYEAYYRHAANKNDPKLTAMTIDDVIAWQKDYVARQKAEGVPADRRSSAAGRYQIIRKTLKLLRENLKLTGAEMFSPAMQDRLAIRLMEGRGLNEYLAFDPAWPTDRFANSLANEWAALPKVSGADKGKSAHDGVGSNKALTGVETFLRAVEAVRLI